MLSVFENPPAMLEQGNKRRYKQSTDEGFFACKYQYAVMTFPTFISSDGAAGTLTEI